MDLDENFKRKVGQPVYNAQNVVPQIKQTFIIIYQIILGQYLPLCFADAAYTSALYRKAWIWAKTLRGKQLTQYTVHTS